MIKKALSIAVFNPILLMFGLKTTDSLSNTNKARPNL